MIFRSTHSSNSTPPKDAPAPHASAQIFDSASSLAHAANRLSRAVAHADPTSHGRHLSRARGGSNEFFDFRPYVPGDPSHRIDWRLFGRTDRLFLRRFRHEGRSNTIIVLDASASMAFAGIDAHPRAESKWSRALVLAAALAMASARGWDRAGLVVASDTPAQDIIPPGSGPAHLARILATLGRSTPSVRSPTGRALAAGLEAAAALASRDTRVLVLSDALDDPSTLFASAASQWQATAGRSFADPGRSQTAAMRLLQLLTPDEIRPDPSSSFRAVDPESETHATDWTFDSADPYADALERHVQDVRTTFERRGGRHLLTTTAHDPLEQLRWLLG